MDRLPEVFKGVSGLQLATGNKERLDRLPYFLSLPFDLRQEKPSVTDVYVISPSAELHREKLLRPQGANQETGPVQQHHARKKALEISLRTIVEPILRQLEGPCHSACSLPENSGAARTQRANIDIPSCLAGVVQEDESGAPCEHDFLSLSPSRGLELTSKRI
jgi:hypothetical protein